MAENKLRDENYYQIQGWMINRLGLKGVTLSVYAIIYGFSQDGENEYTGSLQYLCDFTGGTTKPTIIKALRELVEKQYILRREEFVNGVQFNKYRINLPLLKNFNGGSKEILTGAVKNLNGGSKEILPNNKEDNKSFNKDTYNKSSELADYKQIADLFNSICTSYPSVRSISDARKKTIKARLETYTVDDFKRCFENAENSSFLKGVNDRKWSATFDWLIKDANMAKVLDGNYADKANNKSFDTDDFFNAALKKSYGARAELERDVISRAEENAKNPPKTAADDKGIRERMERLKRSLGG